MKHLSTAATLFGLLIASPANAQFTTVLNIPPDPNVGDSQSIGSDTQLNLSVGGSIGSSFNAGAPDGSSTNIEVNISGGTVGQIFRAWNGSEVNFSGGSVGRNSSAWNGSVINLSGSSIGNFSGAVGGSEVNMSGGSVGDFFSFFSGSELNISGGEYRLDGVLLGGLDTVGDTLAFNLPDGSVLSGTLADGTPFAFSSIDSQSSTLGGDRIFDETLTLAVAALPPIGPAVITLPGDPAPLGIRTGQALIVLDGGAVPDNFNAGLGSVVTVSSGGHLGNNFEAVGAAVLISGGSIGDDFDAFGGTSVFIAGGTTGIRFDTFDGSQVNISGAEYRLDGALVAGLDTEGDTLAVNLPDGSVLSGTLADGTPFALLSVDGDSIADGTLTLGMAALPPIGPAVIMLPSDPAPLGIRTGQTLIVDDGGTVGDDFNAGLGSTVAVNAGQMGSNFEAVGAEVTISGGSVGDNFDAFDGSVVNISGGAVGRNFDALDGSVVNISGGSVGVAFEAFDGSEVNISGGSVGDFFNALDASVVNISGGSVGDDFDAHSGSETNLFGIEFILDGVDITNTLTMNQPFIVTDRDVPLQGLLADGSAFGFDLTSTDSFPIDYFDLNAMLTITLVPLPGDFDEDGDVDGDDFLVWQSGFGAQVGATHMQGDADADVDVDGDDFLLWQSDFSSPSTGTGSAAVPEPAALALILAIGALLVVVRIRQSVNTPS